MAESVNSNTITLRFLAEPSDVNFGGKVHGGAVMKWMTRLAIPVLPTGVANIV